MVLAGIKRDKPKHLFVGSSPVPRTTEKALKLSSFKAFSFAIFAFFPYCIIRQIERKLTRTENTVTALC